MPSAVDTVGFVLKHCIDTWPDPCQVGLPFAFHSCSVGQIRLTSGVGCNQGRRHGFLSGGDEALWI